MKRTFVMTTLVLALAAGLAVAQTAKAPDAHSTHPTEKKDDAAGMKMGGGGMGMMGGGGMGMMGGGGMGMMGGMMAMCPGMLGTSAKVQVAKLAKGATVTITSDDPKVVTRIQKMAEAMRLMHEAE